MAGTWLQQIHQFGFITTWMKTPKAGQWRAGDRFAEMVRADHLAPSPNFLTKEVWHEAHMMQLAFIMNGSCTFRRPPLPHRMIYARKGARLAWQYVQEAAARGCDADAKSVGHCRGIRYVDINVSVSRAAPLLWGHWLWLDNLAGTRAALEQAVEDLKH